MGDNFFESELVVGGEDRLGEVFGFEVLQGFCCVWLERAAESVGFVLVYEFGGDVVEGFF